MALLLVRHGAAGSRSSWALPDDLRPLTGAGRAQAAGLVEILAPFPVARVLSSRYVRCLETVEPLAAARRLEVEHEVALAEEAADEDVLALVKRMAPDHAVLCTHGNVVPVVLDHLRRDGVSFEDHPHVWEKGSTWVLDTDRGQVVAARYLPPAG